MSTLSPRQLADVITCSMCVMTAIASASERKYYFPDRRVSVVYNAVGEYIPIKAVVCKSQITKY